MKIEKPAQTPQAAAGFIESPPLKMAAVVRQAHQPWFDRLTNHGSTSSPTMVRQAHQPWFDRFTNHGSTGSPTEAAVLPPQRASEHENRKPAQTPQAAAGFIESPPTQDGR
jgi:hypothetical protein